MKTNPNDDTVKKNYSKIDKSGTDPNRYSSVYNADEAEYYNQSGGTQSLIPGKEANVGTIERIFMVAAGSYLLYRAFSGKKKSIAEGIAGGTMLFRGISGYCPVYEAVEKTGKLKSSNVNIRTSLTIDRPVNEVYEYWRNLGNLPTFMNHLESVTEIDNVTSEWKAKGPAGIGSISWKAQILMDEPGKQLSWHSLPGSTIDNAGKILFKETGSGQTELDVTISYHAPLGVAGEAAAKLVNPYFESLVTKDIESLKSQLETGAHAN